MSRAGVVWLCVWPWAKKRGGGACANNFACALSRRPRHLCVLGVLLGLHLGLLFGCGARHRKTFQDVSGGCHSALGSGGAARARRFRDGAATFDFPAAPRRGVVRAAHVADSTRRCSGRGNPTPRRQQPCSARARMRSARKAHAPGACPTTPHRGYAHAGFGGQTRTAQGTGWAGSVPLAALEPLPAFSCCLVFLGACADTPRTTRRSSPGHA